MDVLNRGPTLMEPDGEVTTPTPENVRIRVGYDTHQLNAYVRGGTYPCQSMQLYVYPHPVRWV